MKKFIIPILILVSSFANASTLEVCNFPSGISPLIRIYDATISTQTQTWTNTGVVERQVDPSLAKSCYLYTSATLTAGHAYQVDWKDQAVPTKIASESLYEVNTYVDAAVSTRSTFTSSTPVALTSGEHTAIISNVETGLDGQGYTMIRAGKLDNLDASVSSRSTLTGIPQTGDAYAIVNGIYGSQTTYNWLVTILLPYLSNGTNGIFDVINSPTIGNSAIKTALNALPTGIDAQLTSSHGSGSWAAGGSGNTAVNHNFGGADNLRYVDTNSNAIAGADIYAYLASDYSAGRLSATYIQAKAKTGADGRWLAPVYLQSGLQYTLVYSAKGYSTTTVTIQL